MQAKHDALAYPRECKRSISSTVKSVAGAFIPSSTQGKHVALAHLRQCKSSSGEIEKMVQVTDCTLQLKNC